LRVGAEIRDRFILVGQIRHQLREVIDSAISNPHRAGAEATVAPALGLGGTFDQQRARAGFARRQRRAQSGVTAADDKHVVLSGHRLQVPRRRRN